MQDPSSFRCTWNMDSIDFTMMFHCEVLCILCGITKFCTEDLFTQIDTNETSSEASRGGYHIFFAHHHFIKWSQTVCTSTRLTTHNFFPEMVLTDSNVANKEQTPVLSCWGWIEVCQMFPHLSWYKDVNVPQPCQQLNHSNKIDDTSL